MRLMTSLNIIMQQLIGSYCEYNVNLVDLSLHSNIAQVFTVFFVSFRL